MRAILYAALGSFLFVANLVQSAPATDLSSWLELSGAQTHTPERKIVLDLSMHVWQIVLLQKEANSAARQEADTFLLGLLCREAAVVKKLSERKDALSEVAREDMSYCVRILENAQREYTSGDPLVLQALKDVQGLLLQNT